MSALLDVSDLTVRYGGVVAVDGVSFAIQEGSVFGLIGPNGAGKTSMVDALTGYTSRPRAPWCSTAVTSPGCGPTAAPGSASGGRFSPSSCSTTSPSRRTCSSPPSVTVASAMRDLFLPERQPDRTRSRLGDLGLRDPGHRRSSPARDLPRPAQARRRRPGARLPSPASSCWTSPRRDWTPTRASSSVVACVSCPPSTGWASSSSTMTWAWCSSTCDQIWCSTSAADRHGDAGGDPQDERVIEAYLGAAVMPPTPESDRAD